MQYRLRTLLIVVTLGPPVLAGLWLTGGRLIWLFPLPGLFVLWYWMLLRSQAMDPRTRGDGGDYPVYPLPT